MIKKKITIVSGGCTNYFPLLRDLFCSLKPLIKKNIELVILDGGLKNADIDFFTKNKIKIIDPGWLSPLAEKLSKGRNYLKINIAKLNLDQILPDSEIIIWVDGDAWFQNFKAIEYAVAVAKKNKLAIVSQASRLQKTHISFRPFIFNLVFLRNILYKNAIRAKLNSKYCSLLQARPTLNAGFFALKQNAYHWSRFRYWQNIILRKGRLFTSDQLAMGLTIYNDNYRFEALPDICNYMGPWRWCKKTKKFVDYFIPNEPVSVIHMAGENLIRSHKKQKKEMLDMDDKKVKISLRFKQGLN